MLKKLKFKTVMLLGNGLTILLISCIAAVMFFSINSLTKTSESVTYTRVAIDYGDNLIKSLVDMETGMRGYLITGKEVFLEPYHLGKEEISNLLEEAKQHIAKGPSIKARQEQTVIIDNIGLLINKWDTKVAQVAIEKRKAIQQGSDTRKYLQGFLLGDDYEKIRIHLHQKLNEFHTILNKVNDIDALSVSYRIQAALYQQEMVHRTYLMTSKMKFFQQFSDLSSKIKGLFTELKNLLEGEAYQQQHVITIEKLVNEQWWPYILTPVMALQKTENVNTLHLEELSLFVQKINGKKIFDEMRILFKQYDDYENHLLAQRAEEAQYTVKQAFLLTTVGVLASFILIGMAAYFLNRLMMQQLGGEPAVVSQLAQQVADGQLVTHQHETDSTGILKSMYEMVEKLRYTIGNVTISAGEITKFAEHLRISRDDISKGATQQVEMGNKSYELIQSMKKSIDHISDSTQTLTENVKETSGSIKNMVTSVQSVATNASVLSMEVSGVASLTKQLVSNIKQITSSTRKIRQATESAVSEAHESGGAVKRTVVGMQDISHTMHDIVVRIETLKESSEKISSIVDMIDNIAMQTNLLSLNAAIEAARAGEHGKGFAVVADEVRKLARRSSDAVQEIVDLIDDTQTNIDNVISAAHVGTTKVDDGMVLAQQAGDTLDKIVTTVSVISQMMNDINHATEQQNHSSVQLVEKVDTMHQMTDQVGESTKEQVKQGEQIIGATTIMNEMTKQVFHTIVEQHQHSETVSTSVENMIKVSLSHQDIVNVLVHLTEDLHQQADVLSQVTQTFSFEEKNS